MKRSILLLAPALALGMVSGAALVVACGGSTRADAQVGGARVVDATGAPLGTFLGVATGWWPDPGGTVLLPSGEIFAFQDSGGRIWHVSAGGAIRQPEMGAYYSGADCTGTVYLQFAAVQAVAKAAGSYWTVAATETSLTPASTLPLYGTCAPWAGPALALRVATAVSPPSMTPPLRLQ